jgi:hypothetical protein
MPILMLYAALGVGAGLTRVAPRAAEHGSEMVGARWQ